MQSTDAEAAAVLKNIPEAGTTVARLAGSIGLDEPRTLAAVERLLGLRLVEMNGNVVRVTPFAQKARSLFNITA
jgi:hypothetical protein